MKLLLEDYDILRCTVKYLGWGSTDICQDFSVNNHQHALSDFA